MIFSLSLKGILDFFSEASNNFLIVLDQSLQPKLEAIISALIFNWQSTSTNNAKTVGTQRNVYVPRSFLGNWEIRLSQKSPRA